MTTNQETTTMQTAHPAITHLTDELAQIEMGVLTSFTLADAIREGASVTSKAEGTFVDGNRACALGAAFISATARGFVS